MSLNKALIDNYKRRNEMIAKEKKRPKIVTLPQLFGMDEAISHLINIVESFKITNCDKDLRDSYPILVYGSEGLGKTSLVAFIAEKTTTKIYRLAMDDFIDANKNQFILKFEDLTQEAIKNQPCIFFVDDLDEREEFIKIVAKGIKRLFKKSENILVVCSISNTLTRYTKRIKFCRTIRLKRPDQDTRVKIVDSLLDSCQHQVSKDDISIIACRTPSFKAEDLKMMLLNAKYLSRDNMIRLDDCLKAIDIVKSEFGPDTRLICTKPNVSWSDIGGMSGVKTRFAEILRRVRHPEEREGKFSGIILHGPPGCGKTMAAQAMANEAEMNFISIKPGELLDKYLGETEKNICRVFSEAREYEPCMIYFDEFEGLCPTRGVGETGARVVQTLLAEMDGFHSRGKIFVLASTNRVDDIDPAMRRPGRLSESVYVGPPNKNDRLEILKVLSKDLSYWILDSDVNLEEVAAQTKTFTGAELDFMMVNARELARIDFKSEDQKLIVSSGHITTAISSIQRKKNKGQ